MQIIPIENKAFLNAGMKYTVVDDDGGLEFATFRFKEDAEMFILAKNYDKVFNKINKKA